MNMSKYNSDGKFDINLCNNIMKLYKFINILSTLLTNKLIETSFIYLTTNILGYRDLVSIQEEYNNIHKNSGQAIFIFDNFCQYSSINSKINQLSFNPNLCDRWKVFRRSIVYSDGA